MFRQIVERIFSNWTALRLAVEHSMGGPNSKQVAICTIDYIIQYCTSENDLELEDIEDVLDDIMDQEFNTICEDNSIKEVSQLLYNFLQLLKTGDTVQLEKSAKESRMVEEEPSTSCQTMNEDLPEDAEWTQVKSRRKK
ncbi:Pre-rRNA-processing protein TSR2 [Popillia japonica]|uniref:Pre-rRNA-processing protein TSR2 homolog n=1 Tax=Popillia japonica TaxID=7064 RepID=A0AAW1KLI3_POPJA